MRHVPMPKRGIEMSLGTGALRIVMDAIVAAAGHPAGRSLARFRKFLEHWRVELNRNLRAALPGCVMRPFAG